MKQTEQTKYEKVWESQEYKKAVSPGRMALKRLPIFQWFKDAKVKSILDCGCGSGRFLRDLKIKNPSWNVAGIDIAQNAIDPRLKDIFIHGALWEEAVYPKRVDAITCCDVLEHVPESYIDTVLAIFRKKADKCCFLSISLKDDNFGPHLIEEPLHLTVKSSFWWMKQIEKAGFELDFGLISKATMDVLLK